MYSLFDNKGLIAIPFPSLPYPKPSHTLHCIITAIMKNNLCRVLQISKRKKKVYYFPISNRTNFFFVVAVIVAIKYVVKKKEQIREKRKRIRSKMCVCVRV